MRGKREKKPHRLGMKLIVIRKINLFQNVISTHNTSKMNNSAYTSLFGCITRSKVKKIPKGQGKWFG